jgi:hypothetical protein
LEKVSDMLRRSFVCLATAIRIEAQEAIDRATTTGDADLEQCCRRKNNETGDRNAGVFHNAAIGVLRGKLKQLSNKEIVFEDESRQMASIRSSLACPKGAMPWIESRPHWLLCVWEELRQAFPGPRNQPGWSQTYLDFISQAKRNRCTRRLMRPVARNKGNAGLGNLSPDPSVCIGGDQRL